ncbi:MAG: 50S ribosomal protein L1 [Deltaproteobacteria bacterium]|nr:50S ribosomal protein L1 [Deltaproteobacteria bacterium]
MPRHGKQYRKGRATVDRYNRYMVDEALVMIKEMAYAKFDETVDVAVNLGVNPKYSDQMVRGAVVLPHGVGKVLRVAVFAKGEKAKEAEDAGADIVGAEDLAEKIQGGFMDFDKCVATPDMMGVAGKLGRILGPRGMMPNPKVGTVTMDIAKAVTEAKAGKVDFRVDKEGIVHAPVGKISFDSQKLKENLGALVDALLKARPASAKGIYIKVVAISTTMGPGVKIDLNDFGALALAL